jgi:hypothetical protein
VLAEALRAEGARKAQADARSSAGKALDEATRAYALAEGEADRCVAWLDCVRRAPSEIARRTVAALGDMGRVSLALDDAPATGAPCIRVLFDGHEYATCSDGERVLADFLFRVAIRRAAKLPMVPVIVDRRGLWSGPLPEVGGGPVWILETTSDAGIAVHAAETAMAAK